MRKFAWLVLASCFVLPPVIGCGPNNTVEKPENPAPKPPQDIFSSGAGVAGGEGGTSSSSGGSSAAIEEQP
jgi:hypothetical protein